jgi:3-hydroxyacyl-CoA dehydrogenase
MAIRKAVVVGANGTMGAGTGALLGLAGVPTVMLARTREKAEAGRARAEQIAKGKLAGAPITCGSYDDDLAAALADADLVLEAVAEDPAAKRDVLARIDDARTDGTIVATVSSGLSIAGLCAERSADFQACFLGVHLFNPPTAIVGCELIAHAGTDPAVVDSVRDFLTGALRREVVETADTPAFAGNRLGFRLLNEVAQLAEEHGVAYMEQLVGSHTGRVLPPLATIDLVGWDVHKAIVDNLHAKTRDCAHDQFRLPGVIARGIERGHLGRKTRDKGGFFRLEGKGADARQLVLDPATFDYRPLAEAAPPMPAFIGLMRERAGARDLPAAMAVLCADTTHAGALLRRIIAGYVSYGLGLVGEVVARPRDIDRIMAFGFGWAPPSAIVDAIGAAGAIELIEGAGLPVPPAITDAAATNRALFDEPALDCHRFFAAA